MPHVTGHFCVCHVELWLLFHDFFPCTQCTVYLGTWVPGYLGTWVPGYLGTWVPGYLGTWVPGYLGTWVPGYLGTWVPGYLGRPGGPTGPPGRTRGPANRTRGSAWPDSGVRPLVRPKGSGHFGHTPPCRAKKKFRESLSTGGNSHRVCNKTLTFL